MQIITVTEHHDWRTENLAEESLPEGNHNYNFQKRDDNLTCFSFSNNPENNFFQIQTNYYIGIDWIDQQRTKAIYVEPKLNKTAPETDFTKMLFDCLKHPETAKHIKNLYEIKWNVPQIEITQEQDLLTPFLLIEFLGVLKQIVKKGLKKSYYKTEQNLYGKIKGKIQVAKTIKLNVVKHRTLENICTFDIFGIDNQENRILKKALIFVKKYLPQYPDLLKADYLVNTLNFISPAFEKVSSDISIRDIKNFKSNAFFKEYDEGLRLSKLILKRFGYNISKKKGELVKTPPFWIDMSALFEFYVLSLLKDRFGNSVIPKFGDRSNELDYLLNDDTYKMVIDAKYKSVDKKGVSSKDVRQVSGYARMRKVHKKLELETPQLIDCLIIYPNQKKGKDNLHDVDLREKELKKYHGIYKLGVKLPTKSKENQ